MDDLTNRMDNLKIKKQRGTILKAECNDMCPLSEVEFRTNNRMVHTLEKVVSEKKVEYKLVKEYLRPAAGKLIKSSELRTIDALSRTCEYLIKEVYLRKENFLLKYEFLFDRFRAVRQDLIVERNRSKPAIDLLKRILRFYIVADYKLCTNSSYDPYVNLQHLTEVLETIISCSNKSKDDAAYYGVYLLLNLDCPKSVLFVLSLSAEIRNKEPVKTCLKFNSAYIQKNFVHMFRLFKKMPLICQLVIHRRLINLEIQMLEIYNWGFSCKNLTYPLDNFMNVSLLNSKQSLKKYCVANLVVLGDDYIQFNKAFKRDDSIKIPREELKVIDSKLENLNEAFFIYDIDAE